MGQKGLKLAFLAKNSRFLAEFFLNRIGGYTPPLNGQSVCSKKLSGQGGTPPPLNGQNSLKRFWQVPFIYFEPQKWDHDTFNPKILTEKMPTSMRPYFLLYATTAATAMHFQVAKQILCWRFSVFSGENIEISNLGAVETSVSGASAILGNFLTPRLNRSWPHCFTRLNFSHNYFYLPFEINCKAPKERWFLSSLRYFCPIWVSPACYPCSALPSPWSWLTCGLCKL